MPDPITGQHLQVGAPNPEMDTSPIVGDFDDDDEVEPNVNTGACYFNGVAYRLGDRVLSGAELLRCEPPGVWVRQTEVRTRGDPLAP